MELYNLVSFLGLFVFIGLGWLFSSHKKAVNWRLVAWGLGLQLGFGLFLFQVRAGRELFWWINQLVVKLLSVSTAGTKFVFGRLAEAPGSPDSLGFFLAFQTLPAIIFFSALMGILYYWGIMPRLIRVFSRLFTKLLNISGAEGLSTASNIFVGVESYLTIKPYLRKMTSSELCTLLTAGMATVASNILALYVFFLQGSFPTIAGHLISASLISAPAAVVMSKLLLPETGQPETLGQDVPLVYERESNLFEAIIKGSQAGVSLIVGIVALLISVLGLVALVDLFLATLGGWLHGATGWGLDLSLKSLLGLVFYPLSLAMGVPVEDAYQIARIVGERLVVTEVASYQDLASLMAQGGIKEGRSLVIAAYALCGFAHLASLAIFTGALAALAPEQTGKLSQVGLRALLAATLACLMTGAIAGTFYNSTAILLQG